MKWPIGLLWCAATAGAMSGCMVPAADFNAAQTQNRALTEQNRALLAEAENRNAHTRDLEDRLIRSEKQLASLQDRADRYRTPEQSQRPFHDSTPFEPADPSRRAEGLFVKKF